MGAEDAGMMQVPGTQASVPTAQPDALAGVNQGVKVGVDLAVKQEQLDQSKQELALKKDQLTQHSIAGAFDMLPKISNSKGRLKDFQFQLFTDRMQAAGVAVDPGIKDLMTPEDNSVHARLLADIQRNPALLEDPDTVAKLQATYGSREEFDKSMKDLRELYAKNDRAVLNAAGQAAKTNVIQAAEDKRQQNQIDAHATQADLDRKARVLELQQKSTDELRGETSKLDQEIRVPLKAVDNVKSALALKTGPGDLQAIKNFQMISGMHRIGQGEVTLNGQTQSLVDRVATEINNWQSGQMLGDNQRAEMAQATDAMAAALRASEREQLSPVYDTLKSRNLKSTQIMSPRQIQYFMGSQGAARSTPSNVPRGTSGSSGAGAGAVTGKPATPAVIQGAKDAIAGGKSFQEMQALALKHGFQLNQADVQ